MSRADRLSGMRAEHLKILLADVPALELVAFAATELANADVPANIVTGLALARACQLFIEVDVHLTLCFCCFLLLVLHYHMNELASQGVSRSDHDTWSLTDSPHWLRRPNGGVRGIVFRC